LNKCWIRKRKWYEVLGIEKMDVECCWMFYTIVNSLSRISSSHVYLPIFILHPPQNSLSRVPRASSSSRHVLHLHQLNNWLKKEKKHMSYWNKTPNFIVERRRKKPRHVERKIFPTVSLNFKFQLVCPNSIQFCLI